MLQAQQSQRVTVAVATDAVEDICLSNDTSALQPGKLRCGRIRAPAGAAIPSSRVDLISTAERARAHAFLRTYKNGSDLSGASRGLKWLAILISQT